ncbi:hypothetical protein HOLleu_33305 [Holothuria leucospilota]|uniref:Uncharacterized protein n=1 Tax=Holothuria leucospilota TaxID=206669 RepID=A0A9Q1BI02_HOLLE|nr:hypothetical protein HOLleu_33305 [Holothuria leucospilota]
MQNGSCTNPLTDITDLVPMGCSINRPWYQWAVASTGCGMGCSINRSLYQWDVEPMSCNLPVSVAYTCKTLIFIFTAIDLLKSPVK